MTNESSDWFEKYQRTGRVTLKTLEEAMAACKQAREGTERYLLAHAVWVGHALREIEKARTTSQAREVYYRAPQGTLAESTAIAKWDDLAAAQVRLARSYEEASQARALCRSGSKAGKTSVGVVADFAKREIQKAKTAKAFARLFALIEDRHAYDERKLLQEAWDGIATKLLESVSTIEEAYEIFENCAEGSHLQKVAGLRMDDFYEGERPHGVGCVYLPGDTTGAAIIGLYDSEREKIRVDYPNIFNAS